EPVGQAARLCAAAHQAEKQQPSKLEVRLDLDALVAFVARSSETDRTKDERHEHKAERGGPKTKEAADASHRRVRGIIEDRDGLADTERGGVGAELARELQGFARQRREPHAWIIGVVFMRFGDQVDHSAVRASVGDNVMKRVQKEVAGTNQQYHAHKQEQWVRRLGAPLQHAVKGPAQVSWQDEVHLLLKPYVP